MTACFVCEKHRDPGLPVAGADELMVLSHIPADGAPVYLGHLVVEPRRHAPELADLTDEEAAALRVWPEARLGDEAAVARFVADLH